MVDDSHSRAYEIGFNGGHRFQLIDRPGTFKVSQAGLALGNHLIAHLNENDLGGRILDAGTGSGAIALLLRRLGATSIAATDISASAVSTARRNELENYGDSTIEFSQCDLFPVSADQDNERFDLIVFNPPGWRTPPDLLMRTAEQRPRDLDLDAMFYGDSVLLRFLHLLPEHLAEGGRAIVGLNSLVGIADIIRRAQANGLSGGPTIVSRLRERVEFPLMFYTDEWQNAQACLLTEFARGREEYEATYVTKGDTIHWFYEITEITLNSVAPDTAPTMAEASGGGILPDLAAQRQRSVG